MKLKLKNEIEIKMQNNKLKTYLEENKIIYKFKNTK